MRQLAALDHANDWPIRFHDSNVIETGFLPELLSEQVDVGLADQLRWIGEAKVLAIFRLTRNRRH